MPENGGGMTILVVEDSRTQALHVQNLLEEAGLRVLLADDGETALVMAQESRPDLIVLDLQLPKLNGLQVCREIKENPRTAEIPVIMLTAHGEEETVVLGLQIGATDFIMKDVFADAVLLGTLRQMGFVHT